MKRFLGWVFKATGALAVTGLLAGLLAVAVVGGMISAQDQPRRAEAIVVLGGGLFRPLHAAKLYAQGFAPEVYVVRPKPGPDAKLLPLAGVDMPPQQELYRRLLLRNGVPESAIRVYGTDVQSTVEEARTLAAILGDQPRTLLLVTSPYHVLRARIIFQDAMPQSTILAIAATDDPFPSPWWSEQHGAVRVVNETAKLAWYLLGGRFLTGGNDGEAAALPAQPARVK